MDENPPQPAKPALRPTWARTVALVRPYVVRISTPNGHGTGFLFAQNSVLWGIATAAHVVRHEHAWEEIIRIELLESGKEIVLHHDDRAIIFSESADAAAIVVGKKELQFPGTLLPLIDPTKYWGVGIEIGWLGYPGLGRLTERQLCFFTGSISAWLGDQSTYLVDGVAIHGVSGGPAFTRRGGEIFGIVTAYIPNLARGQTLPGLACVVDVAELQSVVQDFRDLDQAQQRQTPPSTSADQSGESPEPQGGEGPPKS